MKKRTRSIITLFVLGVAAAALSVKVGAFSFNPNGNPMGFGGPPFGVSQKNGMPLGGPLGHQMKMIQSLGLSENQTQKMTSIISEFRPQVQASIVSLHQGRAQLRSMAGTDMDESEINTLADKQGQTIASLIKLRGKIGKNIRSVLTLEQKNQLAEKMSNRPQTMFGP